MPAAPAQRWPSALAFATLVLFGALTTAWLTRVCWILAATARSVGQIPRAPAPPRLSIAGARARVNRIECIADAAPVAVCCGTARPSVLVSEELVEQLSLEELVAVLIHEDHHARRRDPLRRAMLQATADILFWLPVVSWWAERRREASELLADRAALRRTGRSALAGALWKVGSSLQPERGVAFGGAAELRVAQVLGDALPYRPLPVTLWLGSAAGGLFALNAAWCLAHVLGNA